MYQKIYIAPCENPQKHCDVLDDQNKFDVI